MTLTHFSLESVHFNFYLNLLIFHLKRKNNKLWSFTYLPIWNGLNLSNKHAYNHTVTLWFTLCRADDWNLFRFNCFFDKILSRNNDSKNLAYNSNVHYFCSFNRQNVDRLMSNCIFGQRNIISNIFEKKYVIHNQLHTAVWALFMHLE